MADGQALVPHRKQHFVDDVAGPLVVNEIPRSELGDRQEARARNEVVVATPGAASWDEG